MRPLVELLAARPCEERRDLLAGLPREVLASLAARPWPMLARREQLPPSGRWMEWMLLGGRGAGKTRAGAEWVHERVRRGARRIALIGATAADTRDVMVEGPAGLLATATERLDVRLSRRQVSWPNGAVALLFSAEEPDRLRGPQHDTIWGDEMAAWADGRARDALAVRDMALMGLRVGDDPRAMWTTTPRPWLREIIDDPHVAVTVTRTMDNIANLPDAFVQEMRSRYEGTRLGRQELDAEVLDDLGAMFRPEWLPVGEPPAGLAGVRAWDLAASTADDADETATCRAAMVDDTLWILDVQHGRWSPAEVEARIRAVADLEPEVVVGIEREPGAAGKSWIEHLQRRVLPDRRVIVLEPSGPKTVRAQLLAAMAEQGRVMLADRPWARDLVDALVAFPDGRHDDLVDAAAYACRMLARPAAPSGGTILRGGRR